MTDTKTLNSLHPTHGISTELLFRQMTDMVFVMSVNSPADLRYAMLNPSAMKASGLNEYAYGATFHDVVEPAEAEFLFSQYSKVATLKRPVSFVLDHEGQIGESLISPITNANGMCTHIIGVVRDITERFHREKNLEYLAFRDELTGLFNRHALYARLQDAVKKAEQTACLLHILLLDCDKLKLVNDTFGHIVGDMMLQEVAKRIQNAVPKAHTIARVGGDEFLIAALTVNEMEVFEIAERMLSTLRMPWHREDINLRIPASIGIATYLIDSMDIQEVIEIADKGMYTAKQKGGNQYMLDRLKNK